ncbi:hypothetical protein ACFWAA_13275 [Streptomyces sp. NPDC059922]|uniref:hypothetical protein n=1 Tax=Streptomyces sp. NPDC059922 TaxID=3347005 RepID=UPI00364F69D0
MNNWISVVVILGLIVVGVLVIHLVNGQHRNRIATYSFGRSLWEPPNATRPESDGPTQSAAPGAHVADTDTEAARSQRSHGLQRLSGLISGRDRRRRKAAD